MLVTVDQAKKLLALPAVVVVKVGAAGGPIGVIGEVVAAMECDTEFAAVIA